jgi:hypothetical protein
MGAAPIERESNGHFKRGQSGNPGGSPSPTHGRRYRKILDQELTDDKLTKIIRSLISRAEKGEPWAVKELLNRLYGKPVQAHLIEGNMQHEHVAVKRVILVSDQEIPNGANGEA